MAVTTVLSDERSATIVSGGDEIEDLIESRFSWSAAIAGSLISAGIALLLLALGSGIGLSPASADGSSAVLAAFYVFVALVIAFSLGGYFAGRLMEPAREDAKDERFRSMAHGLVAWAIAALAMTVLAAAAGIATRNTTPAGMQVLTDDYVGYWTDMLFRPPPGPSQAWLGGTQYAQADTGNATDSAPQAPAPAAVPSPDFPETSGPFANTPPASRQQPPPQQNPVPAPETPSMNGERSAGSGAITPEDVRIPQAESDSTPAPHVGSDKAEVTRIIKFAMANDGQISQYDKDRITALIVQDTNLALSAAQRRVDNAEARIHDAVANANAAARKTREQVILAVAASFLFGAIAAGLTAMSARRRKEAHAFGWPRQEPQ